VCLPATTTENNDYVLRSCLYDVGPNDAELYYVIGGTKHDCGVNTAAE